MLCPQPHTNAQARTNPEGRLDVEERVKNNIIVKSKLKIDDYKNHRTHGVDVKECDDLILIGFLNHRQAH